MRGSSSTAPPNPQNWLLLFAEQHVCLVGSRNTILLSKKARTRSGVSLWSLKIDCLEAAHLSCQNLGWKKDKDSLGIWQVCVCGYFPSCSVMKEKESFMMGNLCFVISFGETLRCLKQLGGIKLRFWFKQDSALCSPVSLAKMQLA